MLVQLIALDILLRLAEAHTNTGAQADVIGSGLLVNDVADGLQQNGVRLTAQQGKSVVRCQNVDTVGRLNHGHVDLAQFIFCNLIQLIQSVRSTRINHVGQFRKQLCQL
ncbi:hypothetical protein SDC9_147922 [bioreactor metagenome]|uniref:Uncharacterized protein n=1 Tax=bioreactor metagenome TaxID=1076179 RepID=A0A645EH05_9ZZZZ